VRKLLIVAGVLAGSVLLAYWAGNLALDRASRALATTLVERTRDSEIRIHELDFASVGISSLRSASWNDVRVLVENRGGEGPTERFDVNVERASLQLGSPSTGVVEIRGLRIELEGESGASRIGRARFESDRVRLPVEVDPADPTSDLKAAALGALGLVRSGATSTPIELDGRVVLPLRGREASVRVRVEDSEHGRTLVADRGDLAVVSSLFHEKLTEAEIELISANALRAPRLLRLTEAAEARSREARGRDSRVPKDAYRHVLWSYLLTREFGDKFAEAVTDAHEQRPGNHPSELDMDVRNNRVGRAYANRGVPESEILERVMTDPDVVRAPQLNPG
jgi:hypothetical protein